jgi:hypothetical protein
LFFPIEQDFLNQGTNIQKKAKGARQKAKGARQKAKGAIQKAKSERKMSRIRG